MQFGTMFGLFHNENIFTEDLEVISNDVKEISELKIEIGATNFQIKNGNEFKVETNNMKIKYKEDNGNVEIKDENHSLFNIKNNKSCLIIYIPDDMDILNDVTIKSGAGTVNIENLKTQNLNLDVGAGEVKLNNIYANRKMKINGGAGKISIENSEIHDLEANIGVGEFNIEGKIIGNSNINSGVGQVKIELRDNGEDYKFKISKGLGSITLNGKELENNKTYGDGDNTMKINGGVGNIEILK